MLRVTDRERQVLELIAEGLPNHEIASTLGVAVETVKSHVKNLLNRAGARNRSHLVAIAFRNDLIGTESR